MEFLRAEAQQAAEQFSDKKQVWILDKDHGFAKAYILEDKGDNLLVQKATTNEVCSVFGPSQPLFAWKEAICNTVSYV